MSIVIIDDDTVKKVTEKTIDVKALRLRISEIDADMVQIKALPDKVSVPNTEKEHLLSMLELEKIKLIDQIRSYGLKE